jgi:hypothetical protein
MCESDSRLREEGRVRGTLRAFGLAESPPHPDHISRCDPASRKRGEANQTVAPNVKP